MVTSASLGRSKCLVGLVDALAHAHANTDADAYAYAHAHAHTDAYGRVH
jgi:hypothetical protein